MIAFACSHCGMKFQVKDEFAGRQTKCPTCKQRLTVPTVGTLPEALPARLDGPASSLYQAGLAGATPPDQGRTDVTAPEPPAPAVRVGKPVLTGRPGSGQRYALEGEIARGGMGAVLRAVDGDLRREIAVKVLLDRSDTRKKARFVEEAQVTGQLEHPNIVPIYDLGADAQGSPYLTMKLVKGRSLAQVLGELRQSPQAAEKDWSLGRLLTIFVSMCHALSYAHARGVIHRDLKPANIMLGDFGEVYVMDWGLAKVLKDDPPAALPVSPADTFAASMGSPVATLSGSGERVQTSREDADLTQDGAVLGTPAYMPPEQARGDIAALDERSDVYSLGAILYELLALKPPVDKDGGILQVLLRVTEGQILPPEQRAPERARAGQIPPELSAIARKALSRKPEDRYANVEGLRIDIERYLEGRSVSAKQDTFREAAWKLVRRNKGVSVTLGVLVPLLLGIALRSAWTNYRAEQATAKAYQDYREQVARSVPAFIQAAHLAVERRQYDAALAQVEIALGAAPEEAKARLLKAQLLIVRQDFATAEKELEQYLRGQPADAPAQQLRDLCRQAKPDDVDQLLRIAAVFNAQGEYGLVDGLLASYGKDSNAARQFLLGMYRERIEKREGWKGKGSGLTIDVSGLHLNLSRFRELTDLAPLRGMPLRSLNLYQCTEVADLEPLRGMPLMELNLSGSVNGAMKITDLSPLRGMPLTSLNLYLCTRVTELSPLQGMPLTSLDLTGCSQVSELAPLRGMAFTWLSLSGCSKVSELAPLRDMPLTTLNLTNCSQVRDLAPLKDMPLTQLYLSGCNQVHDLTPLQGKSFTSLDLSYCSQVRELAPLNGMPLTTLNLRDCSQVHDLTPLRNMPLTSLSLNGCSQVHDLTPLKDVPLTSLTLTNCAQIEDLSPLRGKSLTSLNLAGCSQLRDLEGLQRMKLTSIYFPNSTRIEDLTPLQGMNLQHIHFLPERITKGMDVLRDMKGLVTIYPTAGSQAYKPEEFWKKYDAGEFKK